MSSISRNSYHSDLKLSARLGILPQRFLTVIPRSSLYRFKTSDYSNLVGSELSAIVENLDLIKLIAQSKAALTAASAVLRVASFMRSIGIPLGQGASIRVPQLKGKLVSFVDRVSSLLSRDKILKLIGISAGRFRSWARGHRLCPSSPLDRCRKAYPQQLSVSEVRSISRAFKNPRFSRWPASSVAWQLINEGAVCASVATITSYATLLGLRNAIPFHRSRTRGSLSALFPDQAWHLDATVLFTDSHERLYLQLVIDNYSRKILAWSVGESISGFQTSELLKTAFSTLAQAPPASIELIVDGGSENNNRSVEAFLATTPIRKLIARVDVSFSNSMIEAVNKILKYQYLFRTSIPDPEHAGAVIESSIADYNDRPHYALLGRTPNQAHAGLLFDREAYRDKLRAARLARMEANRRSCDPCLPLELEDDQDGRESVVE